MLDIKQQTEEDPPATLPQGSISSITVKKCSKDENQRIPASPCRNGMILTFYTDKKVEYLGTLSFSKFHAL